MATLCGPKNWQTLPLLCISDTNYKWKLIFSHLLANVLPQDQSWQTYPPKSGGLHIYQTGTFVNWFRPKMLTNVPPEYKSLMDMSYCKGLTADAADPTDKNVHVVHVPANGCRNNSQEHFNARMFLGMLVERPLCGHVSVFVC